MRATRFALLLAAGLPVSAGASALDPGASAPAPTVVAPPVAPKVPPPACQAPEYRQFDFWLGAWDVFGPKGKQVGSSRIESVLGGCVIAEFWTSASGPVGDGRSHNLYNAQTKRWEQFWVDASGSRLVLSGGLRRGAMVLEGEQSVADPKTGVRQRERITWTPNADASVRQLWESSGDGGKTWTVAFDGTYRRADAGVSAP
jgi:hypothetical protein